jgi:hypothetical protein
MSCFTVAMAASVSVRLGNVRHCRLNTCCAGSATQGTRQLLSASGMRGEARLVFFLVLALRARALQLNLEPINVAQRLTQQRVSSLPQRAAAAHKVSRARLAHARLQRRQKLCVVVLLALVCAAHGGRARQLRHRKQPLSVAAWHPLGCALRRRAWNSKSSSSRKKSACSAPVSADSPWSAAAQSAKNLRRARRAQAARRECAHAAAPLLTALSTS